MERLLPLSLPRKTKAKTPPALHVEKLSQKHLEMTYCTVPTYRTMWLFFSFLKWNLADNEHLSTRYSIKANFPKACCVSSLRNSNMNVFLFTKKCCRRCDTSGPEKTQTDQTSVHMYLDNQRLFKQHKDLAEQPLKKINKEKKKKKRRKHKSISKSAPGWDRAGERERESQGQRRNGDGRTEWQIRSPQRRSRPQRRVTTAGLGQARLALPTPGQGSVVQQHSAKIKHLYSLQTESKSRTCLLSFENYAFAHLRLQRF